MVFVSIFLAILALGFLIFIHELGHYFMAKRVGMRVETFSIGMGRPIFSWIVDGTTWQIGWLPMGGFVKIAGTDTEKDKDLENIKDGYFSKSPWDRIKVSFMGPLVNILFALLAFSLLWIGGGREKSFSEYTKKIGLIDPKSELFAHGIRSGDEIWSFNDTPYHGSHDLIYLGLTKPQNVTVKGAKVDYATGKKSPFTLEIKPYPSPLVHKEFLTTGIFAPASYLIYDQQNPLIDTSPLKGSGLQSGDQIVWIDGKRIFSVAELSSTLNDGRALLTVQRGGKKFLARVPRVIAHDLKINTEFQNELADWQFAAHLNGVKLPSLKVLPYNLTHDGVVEHPLKFIDAAEEEDAFPKIPPSFLEQSLLAGDQIIAVDGVAVKNASEILKAVQERKVNLILVRPKEKMGKMSWQLADQAFDKEVNVADLEGLAETVGTASSLEKKGNLVLLKGIKPKMHRDIYASSQAMGQIVEKEKKQIAGIEDPVEREQALRNLEKSETKLELGVILTDLPVEYNPVPTTQFMNVVKEIGKTLRSLVTGALNVKWMSGPVGIVHIMQQQSRSGMGEMLYWLGMISLNLGLLNLLPIPMLDGGTIVINFFEMITRRKIKPQTLEKIILPFAILLILFFLYLTYNDILRWFGR